jgi:outer membrane immunogenic protein
MIRKTADLALILLNVTGMKQLIRLMGVLFVSSALTAAFAGTEMYRGNESKVVAPAPVPTLCDWTGFYMGLHAGGQFGHSETTDLDEWNLIAHHQFGYSESGFNGGAQFGYNFQWHRLVTGPEFDVGYMNLHGHGTEPGSPNGDSRGETDSDFYTTLRGRVGVALDCWLIYATGGGIGVNYTKRFIDDSAVFPGTGLIDARDTDFNWGWTVGGGVERMINRHWSIKAEYLYYKLDDEHFSGVSGGIRYGFNAETEGHILRAGLNYKF